MTKLKELAQHGKITKFEKFILSFIFNFFSNYSSTCSEGEWKCDNVDCKDTIKCPNNQLFSKTASACPKTCGNKDHYRDCEVEIEGCACPNGTVIDYNVFLF